ncbi:MAG: MFS transporter [Candidatus Cardinium sp.]|nr:MFS transporter [Candidatus Cardinium sp.]
MKVKLLLLREKVFPKERCYLIAILLNALISGSVFSLIAIAILTNQLAEAGYPIGKMGILAFATCPYSLKILWAPFLDRYTVPFLCAKLGRRRGWAMAAQICLLLALLSLNLLNISPHQPFPILPMACIIFTIALFAAIQDTVWETYRIERPNTKEELPLSIASSSIGFRLGMFIGSVLSLDVAAKYGWHQVYQMVFLLAHLGPITILCIREPTSKISNTLQDKRNYFHIIYKSILLLKEKQPYLLGTLFFLLLYKSNDILPMTVRVYLSNDLSFRNTDVSLSTKIGTLAALAGSTLSGMLIPKTGIYRGMRIAAIVQLLSPFMLMLLALIGHDILLFIGATAVQFFVSGLAVTAFTTYSASLCTSKWKTTQYTIIASINSILRILLQTVAGLAASYLTWTQFFLGVMLLGIIAIVIFPMIFRKNTSGDQDYT